MSRCLARMAPRVPLALLSATTFTPSIFALTLRSLHSAPSKAAEVSPLLGAGPPPEPPVPSAEEVNKMSWVMRRRRLREMLGAARMTTVVKKRFWEDVSVREVDGSLQIFLDHRPLRHPTTKSIICLPTTKSTLATALALEWDHLTSAADAAKSHLLPLTSLTCRALDIAADDALATPTIRPGLVKMLLRYLDTDSILCWTPEPEEGMREEGKSLRDVQREVAEPLIVWLTTHVWPGIMIEPALDNGSIFPKTQSLETRAIVEKWAAELSAFDLAGLERAVIAGKSFLVAARVLAEWSENSGVVAKEERAFSADAAAKAANIEVDWQIGRWGEVEDTHDVEKQDIRRHYGSVILLVSGNKQK